MMATEMSLKLLVDKNRNKVLYAESGKEFVDFLFSLLALPLATVVRLLITTSPTPQTTTTGGCIDNIYSSVDNLDNLYMQPNVDKSLILQPKTGSSCGREEMLRLQLIMQSDHREGNIGNRKPPPQQQSNEPILLKQPKYYRCSRRSCGGMHNSGSIASPVNQSGGFSSASPPFNLSTNMSGGFSFGGPLSSSYVGTTKNCCDYVTTVMGSSCSSCGGKMTSELHFVAGQQGCSDGGGGGGGGYVKEVVTYIVSDDLEVKPMSTISCITILNSNDVKDIGTLEERLVHLGKEEGLDLLRASLKSKSVLTDVFLKERIN